MQISYLVNFLIDVWEREISYLYYIVLLNIHLMYRLLVIDEIVS